MSVIDLLLNHVKDTSLWGASLPVGSESIRFIKLIKEISRFLYDFQRFNIKEEMNDYDDGDLSIKSKRSAIISTSLPYEIIDIKFPNISNIIQITQF